MKKKRNVIRYSILGALLFLFWMALTASAALLNIILGVTSVLLVVFFVSRLVDKDYYADLTLLFVLRFPRFGLYLLWEIIKANIDVALIILNPRLPIDPRIFKLPVRLTGDLPRSVYAASITLTPGTVVVEIGDDFFLVHALAARHESGLVNGQVEETIARLFGQTLPDIRYSSERVK